jgi:hypothetical protein
MVLVAALQDGESRDDAFTLFGQELLVKNRNHHRALRRELVRVRELVCGLGGEVDAALQEILDAED